MAIEISEEKQLEYLCESIRGLQETYWLGELVGRIAFRLHLANEIVSSPLYTKFSKGSGALIRAIAKQTKISAPLIYRSLVYFADAKKKKMLGDKGIQRYALMVHKDYENLTEFETKVLGLRGDVSPAGERTGCEHSWVCSKCGAKK